MAVRSLFALLLFWVAAHATAQSPSPTVLQISSWVPPGHFIYRELMAPWAAGVEKASHERLLHSPKRFCRSQ